jgi:hypothetical protein
MNPSIPTGSSTNGKAKALVDAYRLCFLLLSPASRSIPIIRETEVPEGNKEGKKCKSGRNFCSLLLFCAFSSPPRISVWIQKISPEIRFLRIHFVDGVTYKRITLAETLSNESLVRVLDKDKQEGRLDLIQPAFLFTVTSVNGLNLSVHP